MRYLKTTYKDFHLHHIILGLAACILAFDPVLWLVGTWQDPSYDSKGFVVFALCVGLFIWSMSSKKVTQCPIDKHLPFILLALSALVRLIGQVAAINVIGALTLMVDVFAIASLCGLQHRKRAVSPLWLAICFLFALPLERIIQRTIGYCLQNLSANGACSFLQTTFDNVQCHGVRILINAQDVMVDLPCSGARSVLLLLFFFCVCAAISRFRIRHALLGLVITLCSALIMNMLRITILAVGIAYPVAGIDVMAQPAHDLIGLVLLGVGSLPIIVMAQAFYRTQKTRHTVLDQALWSVPYSIRNDAWWLDRPKNRNQKGSAVSFALFCLVCSLLIVNLPRKAIDVARADIPLSLPVSLDHEYARIIPLSAREQAYFTQYGGSAKKANYGQHSLMMVRSSAPLRHLHAPDECLRGLGMTVEYKGAIYDTMPSAIYKATDQSGQSYRIAVTFMPDDKSAMTTNVSEAIWRWMQKPNQTWTAIQRISPWDMPKDKTDQFDNALMAALDITPSDETIKLANIKETNNETF